MSNDDSRRMLLDEESFLLGVNDASEEYEEHLHHRQNQNQFKKITTTMVAALATMVVIGTVAVRGIAPKDNSQIHPTSLWSVSSLTSMFQVRINENKIEYIYLFVDLPKHYLFHNF